jgi:phage-related protein
MGVSICRSNNGIPSRKFISGRDILEVHPDNAQSPYYFGTKYKPLSFSIEITCVDETMDDRKMFEIVNWLITSDYKPFISDDNIGKIYYCMCISDSDFITNGLQEGYVELEFRCRDPWGWTLPQIIQHDLSTITVATNIEVRNYSNVNDYYYPEMQITLSSSNTAVSLVNLTDNSRIFSFTSLATGEVLQIDNQKKIIASDETANRFDKFNKNWFRLKKGVNTIKVTGKCIIIFRLQFPIFN